MLELRRRPFLLHQDHKSLVHYILGLGMTQAQRPAIQNQFCGLRFVEPLAPML